MPTGNEILQICQRKANESSENDNDLATYHSLSTRFAINLMDGPDTDSNIIPFHASVRPNSTEFLVELNSCRHGGWEHGTQIRPCPLRPGQAFEMLVLVDNDNYKVGSMIHALPYRVQHCSALHE